MDWHEAGKTGMRINLIINVLDLEELAAVIAASQKRKGTATEVQRVNMPSTLEAERERGNYSSDLLLKWKCQLPLCPNSQSYCWWTGSNVAQNHLFLDDMVIKEWLDEINSRASTLEAPSIALALRLKRHLDGRKALKRVKQPILETAPTPTQSSSEVFNLLAMGMMS